MFGFMKRIILVAAIALIVGIIGGYFIGAYSVGRQMNEWTHVLVLGNSALKTQECTLLLKGFRSGNDKLMMDRLESLLDFSLIDLAREYSTTRDWNGDAMKSLQLAKDYRTSYPHRNTIDSVAKQVDDALALAPKTSQAK
jgi:hypothetical protein